MIAILWSSQLEFFRDSTTLQRFYFSFQLQTNMRNCAISGCTHSSYTLERWQKTMCEMHKILHSLCTCQPPFTLHPFPTERSNPEIRKKWIKLINRKDTTPTKKSNDKIWHPARFSRVCSEHFIDGKPTLAHPCPTLKLGYEGAPKHVRPAPRHRNPPLATTKISSTFRETPSTAENDHESYYFRCTCSFNCSCVGCLTLHKKCVALQHENNQLKEKIKSVKPSVRSKVPIALRFLKNNKSTRIYTGLHTKQAFEDLFKYISKDTRKMRYWKGSKKVISSRATRNFVSSPKKSGPKRSIIQKHELLLVLIKLRHGVTNQLLADIFGLSFSCVSSIFNTWIKMLAILLKPLIFWPNKILIQNQMPKSLRQDFAQLRCTIDCTEIFIDRPRHLELQAQTWSDYKKHNTLKFLVGIAPNGHISFLSKAWGGRASDQLITRTSGFLDLIDPMDVIMADRGFPIQNDLLLRHAKLYIPPPSSGLEQHSRKDVLKTKKIANARIHVERAIGRLKWFTILKNVLPISLVPLADDIIVVCAALCNLLDPLVD